MVFLIIGLLAGVTYVLLQAYYLFHWHQIPSTLVPSSFIPQKVISIIIVAHSEEENIEACIQSVLKPSFPEQLIEVIVIDDRSTDNTAAIVRTIDHPSLKFFSLEDYPTFIHPPAFKKSGIELGVHLASSEVIIVTDADCKHHKDWLRTIAFVMETQDLKFLTAPVLIIDAHSELEKMQSMENLSLMLITGAGIESKLHRIANGANMAFKKSAFQQVNGFEGNYQYASGDDMFLIEKMYRQYPDKIAFLKSDSAVVKTYPKCDWPSLIKQRIRWAKKNKGLANPMISRIWMFVGFYHILILFFLLVSFFDFRFGIIGVILIFLKWTGDYFVTKSAFHFFKIPFFLNEFLRLQFLYMIYILRLGWGIITGKKGDW